MDKIAHYMDAIEKAAQEEQPKQEGFMRRNGHKVLGGLAGGYLGGVAGGMTSLHLGRKELAKANPNLAPLMAFPVAGEIAGAVAGSKLAQRHKEKKDAEKMNDLK